jgi:hypothetical protein
VVPLISCSLTTVLDYRVTLSYLSYLGMAGDTVSALAKTRRRREERRANRNNRGVLLCYVVGAVGCGKSAILRRLVRRSEPATGTPAAAAIALAETGGAAATWSKPAIPAAAAAGPGAHLSGHVHTKEPWATVGTVDVDGVEKYLVVRICRVPRTMLAWFH